VLRWLGIPFLGSLIWACPLCEIFAVALIPLATAWSVGRWGTAPFRALRRVPFARSRRPIKTEPAGRGSA
jgi:hypothetical protein